jgi:hypothetical protein
VAAPSLADNERASDDQLSIAAVRCAKRAERGGPHACEYTNVYIALLAERFTGPGSFAAAPAAFGCIGLHFREKCQEHTIRHRPGPRLTMPVRLAR